MSRNLLKETLSDIQDSGHSPSDIAFIGSEISGHCCSWEQFEKLADFNYNDGFGSQKIATDLIIVFKDGSKMWRGEYDGSESWEYGTPFKKPEITKPISCLGGNEFMWDTLHDIDTKNKD